MSAKKKETVPLVLRIEGTRITAERFLKAADNFFNLLRNVADDISGQKGAVTWIVSAEKGSQVLIATPEADEQLVTNVQLIPKKIHDGFCEIEKGSSRPEVFSDTALRHARELAFVVGNGDGDISRVLLMYGKQTNVISEKTSAHVAEILGAKRTEDGSVEGRVTVLSDRKGLTITIDDTLTGQSVRCTPRDIDEQELIRAFRTRITAIGTVHFRRDGAPVRIEVDSIRKLGKRDELPGFEDVRGIFRRGD